MGRCLLGPLRGPRGSGWWIGLKVMPTQSSGSRVAWPERPESTHPGHSAGRMSVPKAVTRCAIARDRWHNVHGGAIIGTSVGFRRR